MKRSRQRPITEEVNAPVPVNDEETRPVGDSLEHSLQFEAIRQQSAAKDDEDERDEADEDSPHRRKTAKAIKVPK